ncbi:MAG: NeuD/PglB/VioB family sugar acetyltransferase [Alphaproteobacteria bacterium]|nr:NeuD/PglB/VioB family sugar acetyltransferase [Alphaproteobacteria bacterium]
MKNKTIIFGCGGHARSVADVLLGNQPNADIVFIDSAARDGEQIFGFPVLRDFPTAGLTCYCAVGDNITRHDMFAERDFESLVAHDSYLGRDCKIGSGAFVAHHAHIGPCAIIGKGCIINTGAVVEHEVNIGDFCHVSVNATVCGRVQIGNRVFVGAGVTIRDKIRVCDDVIIGCGSSVVKDITEPGVYGGCPVHRIGDFK